MQTYTIFLLKTGSFLLVEITSVSANLGKGFYNFVAYNSELFEFQVNCDRFPTILMRTVHHRLHTFPTPLNVLG